jgi:hypothetical protein
MTTVKNFEDGRDSDSSPPRLERKLALSEAAVDRFTA